MINILSILFYFFIDSNNIQASSGEMFVYGTFPSTSSESVHTLYDSTPSYPRIGFSSLNKAHQIIVNRSTKTMPPQKTKAIFQKGNLSILHPKFTDNLDSYDGVSSIFDQSDIGGAFDNLVATMKSKPYIIAFLRKIHINALNELYQHLMGVYINMNLQHFGMQMTAKNKMQLSVPLYLQQEDTYQTNIKMLIIDHLINIIESQFNGAIRSYAPQIPQTIASYAGRFAICNDYSVDLTQFIDQQVDVALAQHKQEYLQALVVDMIFFETYTSYLQQPHQKHPNHFTQFVAIAEKLATALHSQTLNLKPAFFHFEYEDIAALKIIPYLAKQLNPTTQNVAWPEQIVQAANEGAIITPQGQNGHPLAYFRTSDGRVVKNLTQSAMNGSLFICLRAGESLFEEEVIAQPNWLNSYEGIITVLQACYGNLEALASLNILNPCMQQLVEHGITTKIGGDANSAHIKASCSQYLAGPKIVSLPAPIQPLITPTNVVTNNALTNILLDQPNA